MGARAPEFKLSGKSLESPSSPDHPGDPDDGEVEDQEPVGNAQTICVFRRLPAQRPRDLVMRVTASVTPNADWGEPGTHHLKSSCANHASRVLK